MSLAILGAIAAALYLHSKAERRNPMPKGRNLRRKCRNPEERQELAQAQRMSQEFHGTPSEVVELSEKERRLPRYVVALGKVPELVYEPRRHSRRGNATYVHESGDNGFLQGKGSHAPVLCADPKTGKPIIVGMKSGMRLDSRRGLIG